MKRKDNLVWIDLEMTGLDPKIDTILEIATIVTDKNLQIVAHGPDIVIHHPDTVLENMNAWCKETHAKSGLYTAVQESTTTLKEAEKATLEFIKKYCFANAATLCGNTIWQDRFFLRPYMPKLEAFLHYQMIDVSSVKRIVNMWYPDNPNTKFVKKDNHRALSDIEESIKELEHYRTHFFIQGAQ